MELLQVNDVKKTYTTRFGGNQVQALKGVSFTVEAGEYVAIMGESGSGKTTLLNILAALDQPTGGRVMLDGQELSGIRDKELAAFRRENLGFVFQEFNLLDTFSLKDNIVLPLVLSDVDVSEMEDQLAPVAEALGISDLLNKFPYEVSGGQKQRAAAVRTNMKNNYRFFIPRILSEVGLLGSFYIMLNIARDHRLAEVYGGSYLPLFMGFGAIVLAILTVILMLYTNSFLMKQRKQEFGLYNVLGMEKKQVGKVLFYETLWTSLIAIAGGLVFGTLFYKICSLLVCRLLHADIVAGFYYVTTTTFVYPAAFF